LKRAFDLVTSALLLALSSPLIILIGAVVRATSDGPALFHQTRVGLGEQSFVMLKFRTMFDNSTDEPHKNYVNALLSGQVVAPDNNGLYKLSSDPRVTGVGTWLRRTSLDELPQLFNVLAGDMSLVGPRPVLAFEAALMDSDQRTRFAVRPGMTGLWQVSGRSRVSFLEQLVLDERYVREQSLRLDLAILLRTFPAVFSRGTQ
jgi:lipopolysaccharide/colanic/teichoic acid biosynthesis glycosyltransferase